MALHCIALPPIDPFLNFNSYYDLRWPSNAVARVYDLHEDLNKTFWSPPQKCKYQHCNVLLNCHDFPDFLSPFLNFGSQ